jgi:hypothetical protein
MSRTISEKEVSMPHVVALYRYPVKGFTPEECDTLTVLDEGRIAGDRALGIRFADTEAADDAWSRKTGMLALINTPGLARLYVRFDERAFRLRISLGASILVDELLNPEGRRRIGEVLAQTRRESTDRPPRALAITPDRRRLFTALPRRRGGPLGVHHPVPSRSVLALYAFSVAKRTSCGSKDWMRSTVLLL